MAKQNFIKIKVMDDLNRPIIKGTYPAKKAKSILQMLEDKYR